MSNIWHYGLMAERWGEFLHETPELEYFQRAIERYGEPVLDVACGAGRLLLPLHRAGIDVEGTDISADMLAQCRRRAEDEEVEVQLYSQPMQALDLPRRYRTIYICGSFGLAGSRADDLETLRRCHAHLRPGGALLLNIQAEYNSEEAWNLWLPEGRNSLPQSWPEDGQPRTASDGSQHSAFFRKIEVDPLEQTYTYQVRLEKHRDGERVVEEEYTLQGNMYLKNEVQLMLQAAGFRDIKVTGDYSKEPATADHDELVFNAVR
ncbi:MAG: methyltransferase domain-containing protein [Anaerolineales bacterium]|nr:methyltransferase domain-containing protein [Anaerolineales bacterium]